MSQINNLSQGGLPDILRRLRALENRTTLNNAAIGRAGMEVYDEGILNISNGTLLVNGLASITGTFQVAGGSTFTGQVAISGPLTISGATDVTGPLTVTGDTTLNGTTDIGGDASVTGDLTVTGPTKLNGKTGIGGDTSVTGDLGVKGPLTVTGATKLDGKTDIGGDTSVDGTLDIKGKSTLQNDLTVQGGGKVKVGGMTLDPSIESGAITFSNGAQVFTNGDSIQIFRGEGAAQVTGTRAALSWGGASFSVDAGGRRISNLPKTTEKPNLYVDGNGYLYRSTEG